MRSMGDGLMVIFGVPQAQGGSRPARLSGRAGDGAVVTRKRHHASASGFTPARSWPACRTSSRESKSVYGAAVHLASRLEHMAQPGDICVTGSTFKLVRTRIATAVHLGHQDVKGFPRPIEVYRLVGMKASRTRSGMW